MATTPKAKKRTTEVLIEPQKRKAKRETANTVFRALPSTLLILSLMLSLFLLPSLVWALPADEKGTSSEEYSFEDPSLEEGEDSGEEDLDEDIYEDVLSSTGVTAFVTEEETADGSYQDWIRGESLGTGILSTLASSNAPTLTSPYSSIDPSMVIDWGGHTYAVYDVKAQWPVANSFCQLRGGHLVTITNIAEWLVNPNEPHRALALYKRLGEEKGATAPEIAETIEAVKNRFIAQAELDGSLAQTAIERTYVIFADDAVSFNLIGKRKE
jgi:hypothetical protein